MDIQTDKLRSRTIPALTIVIHSWATPVVGLLMLAIGIFGGYFGRPLLLSQSSASVASTNSGAASSTDGVASSQNQPASSEELMALVVDQTRHFKGEPSAPVTIIEFSDFQ